MPFRNPIYFSETSTPRLPQPLPTDVNRCQESDVCILSNNHLLNMIVYIYKRNWEDNIGTDISGHVLSAVSY